MAFRQINARKAAGFSLIELTFVLAIIFALVALIIAAVLSRVEEGMETEAQRGAEAIAVAILNFHRDTGLWPIWQNGTQTGSGDNSFSYVVTAEGGYPGPGTTTYDFAVSSVIDTVTSQLIGNTPGYPVINPRKGWHGPYLPKDPADPWGNKYVVNVDTLKPGTTMKAVVVLSAGPDGVIQTALNQEPAGFALSGDDIVYHVR